MKTDSRGGQAFDNTQMAKSSSIKTWFTKDGKFNGTDISTMIASKCTGAMTTADQVILVGQLKVDNAQVNAMNM